MVIPAERYKIVTTALANYGGDAQALKCIEECAELIDALTKWKFDRATHQQVVTEIADVMIMCEQMATLFGYVKVHDEIEQKLKRLEERIRR